MDQNTKTQFDDDKKGYRVSTSVGGVLLGIGAAILCADDPENTEQVESEAELQQALTWWREFSTTRLNGRERSAIAVNMQRVSEADISGEILDKDVDGESCHFMVPMLYMWQRHCVTVLGWHDPRGLDDDGEPLVVNDRDGGRRARDQEALRILEHEREGKLMWPERFPEHRLKAIEVEMRTVHGGFSSHRWRTAAQFSNANGGCCTNRVMANSVSVVLRPRHFRLAPADKRTAATRRFGSSGALRRSS
jgi:hypothetical protein